MADEKREFARNFERCFISIPSLRGTRRRAVLVRGLNGVGEIIVVNSVTRGYKESAHNFAYADLTRDWRPIIPASGYFNVELGTTDQRWTTALYVKVQTERQYRKGLPADERIVYNTTHTSPHFTDKWSKLVEGSGGEALFENKVLAHHLAQSPAIERNLTSIRQAIEMVESGQHHTVAFSKFFCTGLRGGYKYPCLYYNTQLVGCFADGVAWVTDAVMHLRDFFNKRWGVDLAYIGDFKGART